MSKDNLNKEQRFQWAVLKLKEMVDSSTYGKITFNMQEGFIANCNLEVLEKPVDLSKK